MTLLYEDLTEQIIGAAIEVHRHLGAGLLESAYRKCLVHELRLRGLDVQEEVDVPLEYKGLKLDVGYRLDVLVNGKVVVELKAANAMEPVFEAQLLTYLKLTKARIGLLINFNVPVLRDGIKRMIL
jgi:GxxExxY protein